MSNELQEQSRKQAFELVAHTKELYGAILKGRAVTAAVVLKELGDSIFDAVAWEDLPMLVKQALINITRELMYANTAKAIQDVRESVTQERQARGPIARFGSDEIEDDEEDESDETPDESDETEIAAQATQATEKENPPSIEVEATPTTQERERHPDIETNNQGQTPTL